MCGCMDACLSACMHAYIHAYMHACISICIPKRRNFVEKTRYLFIWFADGCFCYLLVRFLRNVLRNVPYLQVLANCEISHFMPHCSCDEQLSQPAK